MHEENFPEASAAGGTKCQQEEINLLFEHLLVGDPPVICWAYSKDYAEARDFMTRSYDSYKEVFEDYHGVLSPSSPGVALKGLKSTGSADFNKVWSYLGTPCISLPLLQGENNLPLGIQVIGEKYDDNRFLGVSSWLEKESEKFNE